MRRIEIMSIFKNKVTPVDPSRMKWMGVEDLRDRLAAERRAYYQNMVWQAIVLISLTLAGYYCLYKG